MPRLRRAALAVALVSVSICLAGVIAARVEAATVVRMGIADLAARCDLAVEARVTSSSASIDGAGRIGTDYALEVARTFAGAPLAQRTIRLPGGVLPDGRGLAIPGMPVLCVGESAVLFLSAENARGERLPIGLAQGRLRVVTAADGARTLVSDVAGLDLVDASGHPLPQAASNAGVLPYAATIERIEAECARRADTHADHAARAGARGARR